MPSNADAAADDGGGGGGEESPRGQAGGRGGMGEIFWNKENLYLTDRKNFLFSRVHSLLDELSFDFSVASN